jgi:hypothetical protein
MTRRHIHRYFTISAAALLGISIMASGAAAQRDPAPRHPLVGGPFTPYDVDREHPVYETSFEEDAVLDDWTLEGGKRASISDGNLVLESEPREGKAPEAPNHLVLWLKKEMPADFLLEFTVRPQDRQEGLNIVFFNARGVDGAGIFDPVLEPRNGVFKQYHSGGLDNYHISYWAAGRGFANLRKNHGFHLAASGIDYIASGRPGEFQTVQVYKRGGLIRAMVDGKVALAFDDLGKTHGPVHAHSGWIGLRQMGHTLRCEYGHFKVFPLLPLLTPADNAESKAELLFREDWKEIPAETPVTQEHVAGAALVLSRHGPAADSIKKSHHDEIPNDPWYIWSGSCTDGRWAISLRKKESLVDLSISGRVRWRTRQSGPHVLRIILELENGSWLVSDRGFGETPDWHEFAAELPSLSWRELDIKQVEARGIIKEPRLDRVRSVGWTDLSAGSGSQGCTRVDWIEVYGTPTNPSSP